MCSWWWAEKPPETSRDSVEINKSNKSFNYWNNFNLSFSFISQCAAVMPGYNRTFVCVTPCIFANQSPRAVRCRVCDCACVQPSFCNHRNQYNHHPVTEITRRRTCLLPCILTSELGGGQ
jgi:hypothetical protein